MSPTEGVSLRCTRQQFTPAFPLGNARSRWRSRSILHLELGDARAVGRGEAAPLPGYSRDTLDAAERALLGIPVRALRQVFQLTQPLELVQAAATLVPADCPSALFALETALLDRLGRQQGHPLWRLLRELAGGAQPLEPVEPVPLCVLLSSSEPEAALRHAAREYGLGARCFKLKIGPERLQPEQDQLLARLRSELGADVALRLDANQTLLRSELESSFAALARHRPEFVEEPLLAAQPAELAGLPCGWALDESLQQLQEPQLESLWSAPGCKALVLKPTCLGGFARCLSVAARARGLGKSPIVSHAFEGRLGWIACAQLAIALSPAAAAGLWPMAADQSAPAWMARGRLHPAPGAGLGADA